MSSQNVQISAQSRRLRYVHRAAGAVVFLAVNEARANVYGTIRTPGASAVAGLVTGARAELRFDRKQDAVLAFQP
jgi:hypothetical protein